MVGKNASVALAGCVTSTVAARPVMERLLVLLFEFCDQVGEDPQRVAAQEAVQALVYRCLLRAGRFAAEEEVMGAGGRSADRERLREALKGLLALLDPDAELDQ